MTALNSSAPSGGGMNYEHVITCQLCYNAFDDGERQPKFLPCHHTFCKSCLYEYVKRSGDDVACPTCRQVSTVAAAGVMALQTNFYIKCIQELTQQGSHVGVKTNNGAHNRCLKHNDDTVEYFCQTCNKSVCRRCCMDGDGHCNGHNTQPLSAKTQECQHKLNTKFTQVSSSIEEKRVGILIINAFTALPRFMGAFLL